MQYRHGIGFYGVCEFQGELELLQDPGSSHGLSESHADLGWMMSILIIVVVNGRVASVVMLVVSPIVYGLR